MTLQEMMQYFGELDGDVRGVAPVVKHEAARACSLCGRPAGVGDGSGAAWVLCADCEGTDAARAAGFTHDQEAAPHAD